MSYFDYIQELDMRTGTQAKASAQKSGHLTVLTPKKDSAIEAALSSIPAPEHSPLDGLRFKLTEQNGRHYFTDVRFSSEFVQKSNMLAVISLLNGNCLEDLNGELVAAMLGESACAKEIQTLVSELQTVLCA